MQILVSLEIGPRGWYTYRMIQPSYLDLPESVTGVDSKKLHVILTDFPGQLRAASVGVDTLVFPAAWKDYQQVVLCGMGGSGIGSELASDLPAGLLQKPLTVVRDYHLPAFVNAGTVVAIVSYSGATEEALSCFAEAVKKQAGVMVVTSGGPLLTLAKKEKVVLYQFTYAAPPRDSLGYLFVPLLKLLEAAGVLTPKEADITAAVKTVQEITATCLPTESSKTNPAKVLAYHLYDHVPVIVGSQITAGVARRWKDQCNEHGKSAAWFDVFPELNHNTVEGFHWPARWHDDVVVILLRTAYEDPQVAKRFELFAEHLVEQNILCEVVQAQGTDMWSQKLSLVALGDWVSYYLALLYKTDPSAIPNINELKAKLRA